MGLIALLLMGLSGCAASSTAPCYRVNAALASGFKHGELDDRCYATEAEARRAERDALDKAFMGDEGSR